MVIMTQHGTLNSKDLAAKLGLSGRGARFLLSKLRQGVTSL
jgi:predicted ArsR family transcriptional regulator